MSLHLAATAVRCIVAAILVAIILRQSFMPAPGVRIDGSRRPIHPPSSAALNPQNELSILSIPSCGVPSELYKSIDLFGPDLKEVSGGTYRSVPVTRENCLMSAHRDATGELRTWFKIRAPINFGEPPVDTPIVYIGVRMRTHPMHDFQEACYLFALQTPIKFVPNPKNPGLHLSRDVYLRALTRTVRSDKDQVVGVVQIEPPEKGRRAP